MRLQTQINEQGILTVPVPQSLRGKQVTILITPTPLLYEDTSAVTAWQRTRQILRQTNELELPRKSHEEIITELRAWRESE